MKRRPSNSGQAVTEMLVALPLILLFAAATFQFTQLFLARVRFEQACGSVLREWAAGTRRENSAENGIWAALGPHRNSFEKESLIVSHPASEGPDPKGPVLGGEAGAWMRIVGPDLQRARWEVRIRCRTAPLFSRLFPRGVPFRTSLAVTRHPTDARRPR